MSPRLHALHALGLIGLFAEGEEADVTIFPAAHEDAAGGGVPAAGGAGDPPRVEAFRTLLRGCAPDAVAAALGEPEARCWFNVEFVPHCVWWYDEGRLQVLFGGDGTVAGLYRARG